MGRVKKASDAKDDEKPQEEKPAEVKPADGDTAEDKPKEEDLPIVKQLKEIDDKYLEIEREYEKEMYELQKKYTERQQPLLEERTRLLTEEDKEAASKTGTPALKGFWLQAMKHLPTLEDQIEEWDEPVLEYCKDITKTFLSDEDVNKGFKLEFHFVENPYFENSVLWKEYITEEESPYTGEIDRKEINVSEINWKSGKNVTVEIIKKKTKGGGAKKAKNKGKETEEPRDSFFRNFFRHLKPDMPVPDDVNIEAAKELADDSDMEDDEEMMSLLMENDYEMGVSVRDHLIPFAVRWYTGEAEPDADYDDDDDDDDDDEDDDEEDSDVDDDDEDEPAPKKKQAPKKKAGGGDGKPKIPGAGDGQKQEECKQQ